MATFSEVIPFFTDLVKMDLDDNSDWKILVKKIHSSKIRYKFQYSPTGETFTIRYSYNPLEKRWIGLLLSPVFHWITIIFTLVIPFFTINILEEFNPRSIELIWFLLPILIFNGFFHIFTQLNDSLTRYRIIQISFLIPEYIIIFILESYSWIFIALILIGIFLLLFLLQYNKDYMQSADKLIEFLSRKEDSSSKSAIIQSNDSKIKKKKSKKRVFQPLLTLLFSLITSIVLGAIAFIIINNFLILDSTEILNEILNDKTVLTRIVITVGVWVIFSVFCYIYNCIKSTKLSHQLLLLNEILNLIILNGYIFIQIYLFTLVSGVTLHDFAISSGIVVLLIIWFIKQILKDRTNLF